MKDKIIQILRSLSLSAWSLTEVTQESHELFYVKKTTDMRRIAETREYTAALYLDGERDGVKTRGEALARLAPAMEEGELRAALESARCAASLAQNPYFKLPEATTSDRIEPKTDLAAISPRESAERMARALFSADTEGDAFLNSAEIFSTRTVRHIVTSWGSDVAYAEAEVKGEYVVQCKREHADVENYRSFCYSTLAEDALAEHARLALSRVRDRAEANGKLPSGSYDILLSEDSVETLLSYFTDRADASAIYSGFSELAVGAEVAPGGEGERISLTMTPRVPYTAEAISTREVALVEEGRLCAIHGGLRFCRYLGVEPIGACSAFASGNGTLPFSEMTDGRCLYVVTFSDFQMDSFSGHFGGEIRLAYLYENGSVTKVTGGSINGSMSEAAGRLVFSHERYATASYNGPFAVRIPAVPVAGNEG